MIKITHSISIEDSEMKLSFIRSAGPGGQHVNKVATAVQLRFDAKNSPAIDAGMFARLTDIAGQRMTNAGEVVITASSYRTQADNREDAIKRLIDLLKKAAIRPRFRIKTKPSHAAKERRLVAKKVSGMRKKARGRVQRDD